MRVVRHSGQHQFRQAESDHFLQHRRLFRFKIERFLGKYKHTLAIRAVSEHVNSGNGLAFYRAFRDQHLGTVHSPQDCNATPGAAELIGADVAVEGQGAFILKPGQNIGEH